MRRIGWLCVVFVAVLCVSGIDASAQEPRPVMGVGVGIPYGVLGVNYELYLSERIAGTAGLGFALEGLGWFLGGRLYHPLSETATGRLTMGYGVTGIVTGFASDTLTGFAGGPGVGWRIGENWSFQADLLLITTEDVPRNADEWGGGGNVKIALGFSRPF